MNNEEYDTYLLLEELNELSQAAIKCLRFGNDSCYDSSQKTNQQKMIEEYNDVVAIIELLGGDPSISYKLREITLAKIIETASRCIDRTSLSLSYSFAGNIGVKIAPHIYALDLPIDKKHILAKKERVAALKEFSIARGLLGDKAATTTELVYKNWLKTKEEE